MFVSMSYWDFCLLFWTFIVCLSIVMVHPLSHRTPKDMSGDAFIAGKMWIGLDSLDSPVSGSVVICFDSMVLTSGSLDSMVCAYLTGAIMGAALLAKYMLDPESDIYELLLKRELGGVSIL